MKRIGTIFLSILLLTTVSCTKPLTMKFDEFKKQIVVTSVFNKDSVFKINLTESASLSENISSANDFHTVDSAQILIYEKNKIIDTATFLQNGNYFGHTPPLENNDYKIIINTNDYDNVYAETTVPSKIKIDTVITTEIVENKEYELTIRFTDKPNENNYYSIYLVGITYYYSTENSAIGEWEVIKTTIPVFNDDLFNGNQYEIKFDTFVHIYEELPNSKNYIAVLLYSISKDYYLFLKSYNKQIPKGSSDLQSYFLHGLKEPVPIYSNINGGIGIFSIYSLSTDTVYLKKQ